jgi:hypothetical protein
MVAKKKSTKKKRKIKRSKTRQNDSNKTLVENFVSLQKVMVKLSIKFDGMTKQISNLLDLFEISAKTLAGKEYLRAGTKENEKILEKIDNLAEQNKIIARGLTLLHEPEENLNPIPTPVEPSAVPTPQTATAPITPQNIIPTPQTATAPITPQNIIPAPQTATAPMAPLPVPTPPTPENPNAPPKNLEEYQSSISSKSENTNEIIR